jgi:serine/threonine-protein kinase
LPAAISLSKETIKLLNVERIHRTYDCGQKYVFIATCSGEYCAIKLFKYGFGAREKRELEFYQKNSHLKGIPRIKAIHPSKGETIVVEEYIDGNPLSDINQLYKNDGIKIALLINGIIDIMDPIWTDLKVHRDLKPANIIIQESGAPVVIDFGIFKDSNQSTITETGFQPNSWDFAAPEQLLAIKKNITYRTDFFSLGIIAYYLYYQRLPFGSTKEQVLGKMKSGKLVFTTDEDCPLNKFFNISIQFDVSRRARTTIIMKEALIP